MVAAILTAHERIAAEHSPLEEVGLLGASDPDATLAEARSLFAEGDLVGLPTYRAQSPSGWTARRSMARCG